MNDEDTLPPMLRRPPPNGKMIVFWLLVMLILSVLLSGCASTLPKCPDAGFQVAQGDDGSRYIVFDEVNWMRVMANIRGLAEGKCRLPVSGEEV